MKKKYLLFDNDGVLVETEPYYFKANVKALREIDIELSEEVYLKIMARGGNSWEVARSVGVSEAIINTQRTRRDVYYQEFISTQDIAIKGVVDVLKELSKTYKMGIVTTSRRVDFELVHNELEIMDFMEFVLCVEDYPRAKPHADPYLAGMKKFGATKEECLIIEDSQRGLGAALNAKIECVIVDNAFTASHDFSGVHYFIKNLSELPSLLKSSR